MMSIINYIFSKQAREEYSKELLDKVNFEEEQMIKIYGEKDEAILRKAA